MKNFAKLISITITIIVLISMTILNGCSASSSIEKQDKTETASIEQFDALSLVDNNYKEKIVKMKTVAENENFTLFLDPQSTDIAVLDKKNGAVYNSNPARDINGTNLQKDYIDYISSLVSIEFYDAQSNKTEYYSNKDSVPYKQVKFYKLDNGIRIEFTLGKNEENRILPPVLSVQTYQELVKKADEMQKFTIEEAYGLYKSTELTLIEKNKYLSMFSNLSEMDLYICRELSNIQKKFLEESLVELGFTQAQMHSEMQIAGYTAASTSVMYTIPLDIQIDNQGLIASVDCSKVSSSEKYKLNKINILQGFMTSTEKEGFMLVPDGAGAIVPLYIDKDVDIYAQRLYGNDENFLSDFQEADENRAIMPVIGLKAGEKAIFGIIEEGAGIANITAKPSTKDNSLAIMNVEIIVSELDYRDYTGYLRQPKGILFPKTANDSIFKVRYGFLPSNKATYSDMAVYFRNYLIRAGVLTKKTSGTYPFYLETYGAIDKKISILGVPVTNNQEITTYGQAEYILNELKNRGVEDLSLRYIGWINGGVNHSVDANVETLGVLGKDKGFTALLDFASKNNIRIFPEADFAHTYKDKIFDGFEYKSDASRKLDMNTAIVSDYDSSMLKVNKKNIRYIVSPDKMKIFATSFFEKLSGKFTLSNISLGVIGRYLNTNYNTKDIIERDKAQTYYQEILELAQRKKYNIMVERGNFYTWEYITDIINLPPGSSQLFVETQAVPFAQIVLHGYINYASNPMNSVSSSKMELLRALETGSSIYYRMIYTQDTVLKKTDLEDLYSMNYSYCVDEAAKLYKEARAALEGVEDSEISNHQMLGPSVFKTTFSNGKTIIVNYNNTEVLIENEKINALSYIVKGGE